MTKKELVNKLRARESMNWDQATRIVNNIFEDIADEMVNGNSVYIPKFGRFFISKVSKKRCKHPETKEYIILPAHDVVRFRMAAEFRRRMNK